MKLIPGSFLLHGIEIRMSPDRNLQESQSKVVTPLMTPTQNLTKFKSNSQLGQRRCVFQPNRHSDPVSDLSPKKWTGG